MNLTFNKTKVAPTTTPISKTRRNAVLPSDIKNGAVMAEYRQWYKDESINYHHKVKFDTDRPYRIMRNVIDPEILRINLFKETSLITAQYHKGIDGVKRMELASSSVNHCKSGPMILSLNVIQEELLLNNKFSSIESLRLQSADYEDIDDGLKNFELMLKMAIKNLNNILPQYDQDWILMQIENFSQVLQWSKKCETFHDYSLVTQLAYRLFTGSSISILIRDKLDALFASPVQGFDFGEAIGLMRSAFDTTTAIQESPMMKKLVSLYSYLLTQGFLKHFGLTLSDEDYSKMEQRAMLSAFSSKKGFFMCVLDTVLFICEKACEWRRTGDVSSFIHTSDEYVRWLKEADRLLNLAPFVGNLAAHGTSYFSFLSNLKDAIERGEAYAKFTKSTAGVDCIVIKRKLCSLQLLQNTEITRRAAQQERAQPMGVLVYGSSSIAKSAFTKMLFNYYGSLFDLDRDDHYRYVRNPMDEYWSNFDSSKWCIQLDDIAFMHPAKCSEVDSTLQDLLNVVNNVPYVPPQAALEDKGKTPVMAKLVVATSNCVTLNAQEYFWCPLAVRRRLPFVVSVKPKAEFLHENQFFIDSAKIRTEDGKFPDLWDITVSQLVPVISGRREDATLKEIAIFSDVNKFLQFFGQACLAHEANQKKAMAKDDDMLTVQVCKICLAPLPHDECVTLQYGVTTYFKEFILWIFSLLIQWRWTLWALESMAYYRVTRQCAYAIVNYIPKQEIAISMFGKLGETMKDPKAKRLIACVSVIGTCFATYYYMTRTKKEDPIKESAGKAQVQGNFHSTCEEQLQKEEKSNVWYTPTVELTTFDVPKSSTSLANITEDGVRTMFGRNCVLLHIRVKGENVKRVMRGVFIRGHQCVTNKHAFKKEGNEFQITVIQSNGLNGVNSNITLELKRGDISEAKDKDLCLFEVSCLPPFKDITPFWAVKDIYPTSGLELTRRLDGALQKNNMYALQFIEQMPVPELEGAFDIYYGHSTAMTEVGMCGSLCVAITPRGPIVMGIHMLGAQHNVGILKVTVNDLNQLAKAACISQRPVVQGCGEPKLNCLTRTNVLTEPHVKSMFRYLETGSLNMYGSFAGFRPKPKSNVCPTPLQKEFLEYYDVEVEHGKPAMAGWEPWRKNVVEMVKPNSTYDKSVLRECIQSYTKDILDNLPEDWEKDLVILSNKAAVNGLPGVMYIDRIACNTSMGFPWSCTKKQFLEPDICEKYTDGVNFGEEVWDRVAGIEECYAAGTRAFPVFTGHLKDEATPLKKCEIKKTRMFTGAPIDWSLVVRKTLLSFVRLLQKNKFVFEAGPGTVAQSAEWGKIHEYLCAFGTDQIVAGDYGKFDKRMLADFILAAFEIIMNIHRAAGFSDQECRTIMCIGEDTAFPLSNINGDLVEFFGTNPSGHPLTVIINSLVNSLYIRYCYMSQNPKKEVTSFKENVHLFTYGDDNIMGVNKSVPWFNHTAIQATLASIGVEYTMADKESESVPFISIYNCSFLKRKWLWNVDVKNWTCPLEEASIIKSLTMWLPSKSIDKYAQMVAVISSANSEYFFYGREIFEERYSQFNKLLEAEPYCYYVKESTLPSYDELVERFNRASEAL
jgi:hypothetical protein